jgi:hypothetical protein
MGDSTPTTTTKEGTTALPNTVKKKKKRKRKRKVKKKKNIYPLWKIRALAQTASYLKTTLGTP